MVVKGKKLASKILRKIKKKIEKQKLSLQLDILYIEKNTASNIYIRNKKQAAESIGIKVNVHTFPKNVREDIIKAICHNLNFNPNCTGYLAQLPISSHLDKQKILNFIDPRKDVDCLTSSNLGYSLTNDEDALRPATVEAIIHILQRLKVKLESKIITVVNDSNLIGKPLAAYLLSNGATVTICNKFTKNLPLYTKQAEIIITATGQANLINNLMVAKKAIVIDAGISKHQGKTVGDVDFKSVKKIAKAITPVPDGVGPVTIACLMQNLLKLHETFRSEENLAP